MRCYVSLVSALILLLVCTPFGFAQKLPVPKRTSKPGIADVTALERRLYLTTMNLIEREYALNHTNRVLELLEETRSSPNRGFEWGYWNGLCHQEKVRYSAADSHSTGGITALAWSPDGRSILLAGGGDRRILVRDVATGKITSTIPLKSSFGSAAFSPDTTRIVTVGGYIVTVCNALTGEVISETREAKGAIRADFTPDGKRIATAGLDGWGQLFDAARGAEIYRVKDRGIGSFYSIAISPDGKLFGSGDDGNFAWIWSTADGTTLHKLKGHTGQISAEAFSPDGKQVATGSWDCHVKLWDTATGAELHTLVDHTGTITCIRYSSDGKWLYTAGSDGAIKIWDTATGNLLRDLRGHRSGIRAMVLSPDGSQLATGSDDGDLMLWDASPTGMPGVKPFDEIMISFNNTKASKLPFRLFGIGIKVPPLSWDGTLAVRPVGANAEVWQVLTGVKQATLEGNGDDIKQVAISRDKRLIATVDRRDVRLWDALTGKRLFTLQGHTGLVADLAFSEDGHWLVTGGADATAKVWDTKTGRLLHTLSGQGAKVAGNGLGTVSTVRFQCGDRRIVTAGTDGYARIWDRWSGRLICSLEGQGSMSRGITISPDGRRICICYGNLSLWDGTNGKKIADLQGISADNARITFSPDSRRLLIGSYGGYARLFETETGRDVLTFHTGGEERWYTTVAFSPDGNRVDILNNAVPPVSFYAKY